MELRRKRNRGRSDASKTLHGVVTTARFMEEQQPEDSPNFPREPQEVSLSLSPAVVQELLSNVEDTLGSDQIHLTNSGNHMLSEIHRRLDDKYSNPIVKLCNGFGESFMLVAWSLGNALYSPLALVVALTFVYLNYHFTGLAVSWLIGPGLPAEAWTLVTSFASIITVKLAASQVASGSMEKSHRMVARTLPINGLGILVLVDWLACGFGIGLSIIELKHRSVVGHFLDAHMTVASVIIAIAFSFVVSVLTFAMIELILNSGAHAVLTRRMIRQEIEHEAERQTQAKFEADKEEFSRNWRANKAAAALAGTRDPDQEPEDPHDDPEMQEHAGRNGNGIVLE